MSRYFRDRNIIPRVRRFVEENRSDNGYVDVDLMVEGLQQLYPDYRRQKKLLLKKNVQEGSKSLFRLYINYMNYNLTSLHYTLH